MNQKIPFLTHTNIKDFFDKLNVGDVFNYATSFMPDEIVRLAQAQGVIVEYCGGPTTEEGKKYGAMTMKVVEESDYRVTWEIDTSAVSHIEAARQVHELYFHNDGIANVYEVQKEGDDQSVLIDLTDLSPLPFSQQKHTIYKPDQTEVLEIVIWALKNHMSEVGDALDLNDEHLNDMLNKAQDKQAKIS